MRRASVGIVAALVTLSLSARVALAQEKDVRGKVTAVSAESITVDVNGEAMTFTINPTTQVIAKGAGTKAREAEKTGQKPVLTDLVKVGDNVAVLPRGFCGDCPPCRAGRPLFCDSGPQQFGGFGERMVITEQSGFRFPSTVSLAALMRPEIRSSCAVSSSSTRR